ncbi:unnamed protein product, partial [marine sediment metagenome]
MEKNFSGIPDVDMQILEKLPDKDLGQVCQTSKYVQSLCQNETFWHQRFIANFSKYYSNNIDLILKYKGNTSWRNYYIMIVDLAGKTSLNTNRMDLVTLFLFQTNLEYDAIKDILL